MQASRFQKLLNDIIFSFDTDRYFILTSGKILAFVDRSAREGQPIIVAILAALSSPAKDDLLEKAGFLTAWAIGKFQANSKVDAISCLKKNHLTTVLMKVRIFGKNHKIIRLCVFPNSPIVVLEEA